MRAALTLLRKCMVRAWCVHGACRLYVHAMYCLGDTLEVPRVVARVLHLLRLYLVLTRVRHLSDTLEVPRLVTLVLYLLRLYLLRHLGDALEVPRLVALVYLLDAEDAPGLDRVKYNDTGLQPGHI